MFGKMKDAVSDAAETLRRVFSDPTVNELRAGPFHLRTHGEPCLLAEPQAGLDEITASLCAMPPLGRVVQGRALEPFQTRLQSEEGWTHWSAGAKVVTMTPLRSGTAARMAVPPLPRRAETAGGRVESPARPPVRRALETLPAVAFRRLDPALPAGSARAGLEAMLRLAVPIQAEDIQHLPRGLWMRYSLQLVRGTGENVRNLEVLGLFHLPRKGVADLRHDASRGRILVRLETVALKAPRCPFILARRKDDGALVSCYLEDP